MEFQLRLNINIDNQFLQLRMSSINWNDLNNSSSLSQVSSDQEHQKKKGDRTKKQEPPALQKTVSSPERVSKPFRNDNSSKVAENLQKLAKHQSARVWLYLPDINSNREQQVEQILNGIKQFEKIIFEGKDRNVLIKTQLAAHYIQKGLYQKGINLKFIYSTRNNQGRKIVKKYSEKSDIKSYQDREQITSPRIKTKQTYNQKTSYQRQRDENEKKKVKYVAKDTINKKIEQSKLKLQQIKQQPKKQIEKQTSEERDKSESESKQEKSEKQSLISNQQKPVESKAQSQNKKQPQKVEKKVESKRDSDSDEQYRQRQREKKLRQKQKQRQRQKERGKTKKVKSTKSGGYFDSNNPFSSLL